MILIDENIPEDQCRILRKWRFRIRPDPVSTCRIGAFASVRWVKISDGRE